MASKLWGKIHCSTAKNLLNVFIGKPQSIRNCSNKTSPSINETAKQLTQYRKFEKSQTCKHVTKLKMSRLANPFPDPVKVMPSDVITDKEKARQSLMDARMNFTPLLNPTRSFATYRKKPKKCPQIKLPNCDRPKNLDCVPKPYAYKKCKKVMAPHPSYSELCHEDVKEKRSECKLCPWRKSERKDIKSKKM